MREVGSLELVFQNGSLFPLVSAAVPIIKYEWYVIDEETQLLAVFLAFCVTPLHSRR
jgi:hypothetical protein